MGLLLIKILVLLWLSLYQVYPQDTTDDTMRTGNTTNIKTETKDEESTEGEEIETKNITQILETKDENDDVKIDKDDGKDSEDVDDKYYGDDKDDHDDDKDDHDDNKYDEEDFCDRMTPGNEPIFNMVYHEMKPFLYSIDDGTPELYGMISDISLALQITFCSLKNRTVLNFRTKISNMTRILDLLRNESVQYGHGELENISAETAAWGPFITAENFDRELLKKRNLHLSSLVITDSMVVILQQSKISIIYKVFFAMLTCMEILFVTIFFCLISGFVFWLLERRLNTLLYHPSFLTSITHGIWWSFVTMTTVGYGDFVPRTVFGKLWSVSWMYLALFSTCIMTATVTSVVYGIEDLSIVGKKIGVLKNSYEGLSAAETFSSQNVEFDTLEEILKAVRRNEVYAGLVNEDLVSWNYDLLQTKEEPLVVINRLPVSIRISILLSKTGIYTNGKLWCCLNGHYNSFDNIAHKFQKKSPVEIVTLESVEELFTKIIPLQILFGVFCVFVIGGVSYDVIKGSIFSLCRKNNVKPANDEKSRIRSELEELNTDFENELNLLRFR